MTQIVDGGEQSCLLSTVSVHAPRDGRARDTLKIAAPFEQRQLRDASDEPFDLHFLTVTELDD
jgi:hypothetical protein